MFVLQKNENVWIIYFEQFVSLLAKFLLKYKVKTVIWWKTKFEIGKFHKKGILLR